MRREPYHFFDPLLRRAPFPWQPGFEVGPAPGVAGVTTVRMARRYAGGELMGVLCYVVGDTLVDAGLACFGPQMTQLARAAGIRRVVVTHHHEDHAGGAAALRAEGVEVLASAACGALMGSPLPIRFYQHMVWGACPPASATALPAGERIEVALGPHRAFVVPAPGHCEDQVVYHVPEQGWLFSGDAFLHERVRLFRRDEDFAATLRTLEHLVTLDFDVLFCAHRPRLTGGKAALTQKLEWLRHLEGEIRRLHGRGLPETEIARRVGLTLDRPSARVFAWLTVGDATPMNIVRSLIEGPRPRLEVDRRRHTVIR
jgi:glyoxylase-like metal-dependent hydrolase (beta-lactamase superfamily II)